MQRPAFFERSDNMTGNDLFARAINLCGLGSPQAEVPADTEDLKLRAPDLINLLLAENCILDCKIRKCRHKAEQISDLNDHITCSEIIAYSVLPYGLARLFMVGEDDAFAAEMQRIYEANRENAIKFGNAVVHPITEVYK